jgi:hypothetical protein
MSLFAQVKKYTACTIYGKTVEIPYSIVETPPALLPAHYAITSKDTYFAGKGTASQIVKSLLHAAKKTGFDLHTANTSQIKAFMIKEGIGVDCSGFVYNVVNQLLLEKGLGSLDTKILRFSGVIGKIERALLSKNRVRRSSADTLTNNLNTVPIEKVSDIRAGDVIRLTPLDWKGKHVLLVVAVTARYIFYAHSSANTQQDGPHISFIKILDSQKSLQEQEWVELTKAGENYGKKTLLPNVGDGARRFKFLNLKLQ